MSDLPSYKNIFTFNNLLTSFYKTRKNKRHKKDVILFESELAINLSNLCKKIENHKYKINKYNLFTIYEPKERDIASLKYDDRIVQRTICDNYLNPLLNNHLIFDNAACRKNKGTDFARKRVKEFLVKYYRKHKTNGYVLKFDIHHYFESIDHNVLKSKISNLVRDNEILNFLFMIIDSYNGNIGKGLPLGNQTSQCFALLYLDKLDRLIKEKYRCKYYSRYMDDGIIIHNDKEELKLILLDIKDLLFEHKISLNDKTVIMPLKHGFNYLGATYQLLNKGKIIKTVSSKKKYRIKRHLIKLPEHDSVQSYIGYLRKYNEYYFMNYVKNNIDDRK